MIKHLGETDFLELQKRAGEMVKRADAVKEWKQKYDAIKSNLV